MLELGEGVGVEEVIGAVDDADVEGRTELVIDVATLDTNLVDVELLDTLALLDGVTELDAEELDPTLVVGGGTNVLWLIVVVMVDGVVERDVEEVTDLLGNEIDG